MNDGVALLLERMKTHPEEFLGERDGKWENLVYRFHQYLPPEDHETFKKELNKLMQQRFTEQVMEELVDPKSEGNERWGKIVTPLVTPTPMPSMLTLEASEHLKAHLKALGQTPIVGVTQTV
jgi:hypothetical protein